MTTWSCTFTGVGVSTKEENGYVDHTPPAKTVRYTSPDSCIDYDDEGDIVAVGDADIASRPNGTITISCTLTPVDA